MPPKNTSKRRVAEDIAKELATEGEESIRSPQSPNKKPRLGRKGNLDSPSQTLSVNNGSPPTVAAGSPRRKPRAKKALSPQNPSRLNPVLRTPDAHEENVAALEAMEIDTNALADATQEDTVMSGMASCDGGYICLGSVRILVLSSQPFPPIPAGDTVCLLPMAGGNFRTLWKKAYIGRIEKEAAKGLHRVKCRYPALAWQGYATGGIQGRAALCVSLDIYAPPEALEGVGKALSKESLYLFPDPRNERLLQYDNPHILKISPEAQRRLDERIADLGLDPDIHIERLGAEEQEDEITKIFQSDWTLALNLEDSFVSPRIRTKLLKHQIESLAFMRLKEKTFLSEDTLSLSLWRRSSKRDGTPCFRNKIDGSEVEDIPALPRGGIIADEMGLGKTLLMLALIATSLDDKSDELVQRPTLVIVPTVVLAAWEEQIHRHTKGLRYLSYRQKANIDPSFGGYDVVLTTFKIVTNEDGNGYISNFPWRRIVLDEAHKVKNRRTKGANLIGQIEAETRWCISGTPMQNALDDYGSLLGFLRIEPVDKREEFLKYIVNPLKSGDTTALRRLQTPVSATTLRRTKKSANLAAPLPPRVDEVHKLGFSSEEREMYELVCKYAAFTIDKALRTVDESTGSDNSNSTRARHKMMELILRLRQVCNHGSALLPLNLVEELKRYKNGDPNQVSIAFTTDCGLCGASEDAKLITVMSECGHWYCSDCIGVEDNHTLVCPICFPLSIKDEGAMDIEDHTDSSPTKTIAEEDATLVPSTKVGALIQSLQSHSEKSVVFTAWTGMLHLIATALRKQGITFEFFHGGMLPEERKSRIDRFKTLDDVRVIVATIGSGGAGIDLTAASRIYIMEPQFNPMEEEQALARVHRIGQNQPVVTVRYIMLGSYEERVQSLQNQKRKLIEICSGTRAWSSTQSTIEYLKGLRDVLK